MATYCQVIPTVIITDTACTSRFSAAAADKVRLLEELEIAQKRESHQLQDELRQRSGDAEAKRLRAASDLEVAAEKIRILEAEVSLKRDMVTCADVHTWWLFRI